MLTFEDQATEFGGSAQDPKPAASQLSAPLLSGLSAAKRFRGLASVWLSFV